MKKLASHISGRKSRLFDKSREKISQYLEKSKIILCIIQVNSRGTKGLDVTQKQNLDM